MPFYADSQPVKWADSGYNSISLEIDIFDIHYLEIKTQSDTYRRNIEIIKINQELIEIDIIGEITAKIKAETSLIQTINGYMNRL